jgi:16S rRNA (adenine1518-N6/adenine1519-N6)-dimethyltransferase
MYTPHMQYDYLQTSAQKTRAKKHLGQHFLTSEKALRQMVVAGEVVAGDTVLEIGPGKGALTRHLLDAGARVVAVEMDTDMVAILEEEFKAQIVDGTLLLVRGDILDTAIHAALFVTNNLQSTPYKLIANIPYYITGEIMRTFLQTNESLTQPTSMTLLVQKEVAERVARSAKESVLSLSVKAYGTPKYISTVPAGSFSPPPKVDSAVLHIADISKQKFTEHGVREKDFFKIVKTGLGSKRKMLKGLLTKIQPSTAVESAFSELGIDEKVRGEDLPLEKWLRLTKLLATEMIP